MSIQHVDKISTLPVFFLARFEHGHTAGGADDPETKPFTPSTTASAIEPSTVNPNSHTNTTSSGHLQHTYINTITTRIITEFFNMPTLCPRSQNPTSPQESVELYVKAY